LSLIDVVVVLDGDMFGVGRICISGCYF